MFTRSLALTAREIPLDYRATTSEDGLAGGVAFYF
jgi:hypothetical protein